MIGASDVDKLINMNHIWYDMTETMTVEMFSSLVMFCAIRFKVSNMDAKTSDCLICLTNY